MATKNKNVFFVGLLAFFGGISQDLFTPIFPLYLTNVLGFDKAFVGIAEGVVAASVNIFKIVAGFFSDKFKKQKPIIFIGYLLSMISRPLLVFFTSGAGVLGLRIIDGTGKGIKDPPKDVLIAGSSERKTHGKSFGIARMLDTLGSVAGPLILFGLLELFKGSQTIYHNILLLTAVPLIGTLLILIFKVRETKTLVHEQSTASLLKGKLPLSFYIFLGVMIFFTIGNASDAFLILRAQSLGVTLLEIPLVVALFNLSYALLAVPFGSLSDRIGRVPTILIGFLVYAIVHFGFAVISQALLVWVLYGFYGIYYAITEGVTKALIADIIEPEKRGRAFGIYGTSLGIATLFASFLAGVLWDKFGAPAPFFFSAAVAALAALPLFLFSKRFKTA